MIHINLLQTSRGRKAASQWDVHAEVAGAIGLLVLTLGVLMFYSGALDDEIQALENSKLEKGQQIAVLKVQVKKVQDFEKKKKRLEDLNRVIETLENQRGGPVKTLDNLSRSLEPLKLWLVRLTMKNRRVEVEGSALENDDVVGLINNLRRGDLFTDITLKEIRAGKEAKTEMFKFKLGMALKKKKG